MRAFIPLIFLLSLLAGCSSGIDPIEPPSELTGFEPRLQAKTMWSRQVGSGVDETFLRLQPLIDGERLYAASLNGEVAAFGAFDGKRLWQRELHKVISAGPGEGADLLLLGGDAELLALDKATGEPRWHSSLSSEVLGRPVMAAGRVLVHTIDGILSALDATNGESLWRHHEKVPTLSLRGSGSPLVVGDNVLLGTSTGKVVALSLTTGALRWEATVASPRGRNELERMVDVDAQMVTADGVLYAAAYQGRVAALNLATGQVVWSRDISSHSGLLLDDETLYLSDEFGDLWAIASNNGATRWKQPVLHRRSLSAPAQQGRYLIVGDFDGYLHWLDKEDGKLAARVRIDGGGSGVLATPLVEGTRVYAYGMNGTLSAFEVSVLKDAAE